MASRDFALVRPPRLASRSCVSRAGKRGGARGREGEPERRSLLFSDAGVGVGGDDDLFSPGREKKTSPTKNEAGRRRDVFVPGQDPRSRRGLVFFLCFRLLSFKGEKGKRRGGGDENAPPKKNPKNPKTTKQRTPSSSLAASPSPTGGPEQLRGPPWRPPSGARAAPSSRSPRRRLWSSPPPRPHRQ